MQFPDVLEMRCVAHVVVIADEEDYRIDRASLDHAQHLHVAAERTAGHLERGIDVTRTRKKVQIF